MLRTVGDQPTLWEAILPEELRRLPEELARVDVLLDDPVFFAPFTPFFDPRIGRPSTPMETYLRLMFLKFRYRLGFESLCREVSDSITWRQFCRIGIDQPVPHPTTLMKLTTRCGSVAVDGLNEALLAKAAEAKLLRCTRVRVDTTVVPSNVAYPTDAGLLAKAVGRIAATGRRIRAAGGATRTGCGTGPAQRGGGRMRSPRSCDRGPRPGGMRRWLRSRRLTLSSLTWPTPPPTRPVGCWPTRNGRCGKPEPLRRNGRLDRRPDPVAGRRRGRLARAVNDLEELLEATRRIAAQTRQRLAGVTPDGSTRRVSLHDPDARPIAKGRLGKPVEFGHKAQVVDNDDGVVLDHDVQPGNPADAPRMEPAIKRVARRTGRKPRTVAADRGYGEASVDDALHNLGVRNVVIPRKGRPTKARQAEEHRRAFRRHLKWRTGCEGRISSLKRGYGWDRSRIDTTEGARIWVGHGVLTHNLVKISALAS